MTQWAESTKEAFTPLSSVGTVIGAEMSWTVPAGRWWSPQSLRLNLNKGGAGGTPMPILEFVNPDSTVAWSGPGASAAQPLSTTVAYNWAAGHSLSAITFGEASTGYAFAPLPHDFVLAPGGIIRTNTLRSVGGTSNYSTCCLFVIELT